MSRAHEAKVAKVGKIRPKSANLLFALVVKNSYYFHTYFTFCVGDSVSVKSVLAGWGEQLVSWHTTDRSQIIVTFPDNGNILAAGYLWPFAD
jgi:hypothetical protein